MSKRRRRSDWVIALGMVAGAAVPIALTALLVGPAPWWSGLVAGLLAAVCGIVGGILVQIGTDV